MMIINFGVFYENKQYNLKTKFNLPLSVFFFWCRDFKSLAPHDIKGNNRIVSTRVVLLEVKDIATYLLRWVSMLYFLFIRHVMPGTDFTIYLSRQVSMLYFLRSLMLRTLILTLANVFPYKILFSQSAVISA